MRLFVVFFIFSINKACESLKNVFLATKSPTPVNSSPSDNLQPQLDVQCQESSETLHESKSWYTSLVSKYLQDCRRMNENSLCKSMLEITSSESRIFFVGQASSKYRSCSKSQQKDLVNMACVLVKLKKYLKQQYQRHNQFLSNNVLLRRFFNIHNTFFFIFCSKYFSQKFILTCIYFNTLLIPLIILTLFVDSLYLVSVIQSVESYNVEYKIFV